jgi:uncharacterized membrane protein YphA (DoxX/SURF4 family)
MNAAQIFLVVFGRIFLSTIFIFSGVSKILHWQIMEQEVASLLSDWHVYLANWEKLRLCVESLMPWSAFLLGMATFLEIMGGLLVFFGIKARLGAFFLFLFLIPTTILYHHFWFLEGQKRDTEMVMFLKNIAILGGVMILWAFGTTRKAVHQAK